MYTWIYNPQRFATQVTTLNATGNDLSPEMKTFYDNALLKEAEPLTAFEKFGINKPLPKGKGKKIEFRRMSPLAPALKPLTEGVTPSGTKLNFTSFDATVNQYGDFVETSDLLQMTTLDPIIAETSKRLSTQMQETRDLLIRNEIITGTERIFAPAGSTAVDARSGITASAKMTLDVIRRATRQLDVNRAMKINGAYICVIHPDVAYDIKSDSNFIDIHKYARPDNLYNGEIGEIDGVRFIVYKNAKIYGPGAICGLLPERFKLNDAVTTSADIYPDVVIAAADATAINAAITGGTTYKVYLAGAEKTVSSVTAGAVGTCKITLSAAVASAAKGALVCGTNAGSDGSAVYLCPVLASDFFAVTDLDGGAEMIVKQLGSSGSADPLDQRATIGWKMNMVAKILNNDNCCRIECGSTYSATAETN